MSSWTRCPRRSAGAATSAFSRCCAVSGPDVQQSDARTERKPDRCPSGADSPGRWSQGRDPPATDPHFRPLLEFAELVLMRAVDAEVNQACRPLAKDERSLEDAKSCPCQEFVAGIHHRDPSIARMPLIDHLMRRGGEHSEEFLEQSAHGVAALGLTAVRDQQVTVRRCKCDGGVHIE